VYVASETLRLRLHRQSEIGSLWRRSLSRCDSIVHVADSSFAGMRRHSGEV
jgi:hypothetical protein